ncbi:MAG: NYN domain-containing protein [Nocardioidaceae bacterium]
MDSGADANGGTTYLLVDGENIDATLGTSILGRRPRPEERPRWDRLLEFARDRWAQQPVGLFFLAVNGDLPMSFVQALVAMGYRPVPLAGDGTEKVVDIAIQRTMAALADRDGDVLLVSNDGDFVPGIDRLLEASGRRVGVLGFTEFRNQGFAPLAGRGLELLDLEYDVHAFNAVLPRVRIIPIDQFDPLDFL